MCSSDLNVPVSSTYSVIEDADSLTSSGTVSSGSTVDGTFSATEDADSLTASGESGQVASEPVAAGRIKRTRILLEHRNKRLFFDSESEVLAFLEAQRESATESLKTLGNRIVVEHGKPVLKARPHIVKVKTDDEDVKKLVDLTNRQIQAEFDRYREMILKVISRQIEEEEEEVLIALML